MNQGGQSSCNIGCACVLVLQGKYSPAPAAFKFTAISPEAATGKFVLELNTEKQTKNKVQALLSLYASKLLWK